MAKQFQPFNEGAKKIDVKKNGKTGLPFVLFGNFNPISPRIDFSSLNLWLIFHF